MWKQIAILALCAGSALSASAQSGGWSSAGGGYGGSGGDYSGGDNERWRNLPRECWNASARDFEAVRSGERQDELDFGRCRLQYEMECWSPRARRFEPVRGGEKQEDLDFVRCRRR